MSIFSFQNFINEKFGVSNASLIFEPILNMRVSGLFREFLRYHKDEYSTVEIIDYPILRPFITDKDLYSEFPVVGFELKIDFKRYSVKDFEKKYPNSKPNIATGGFASYFGNKNWKEYSKIVEPIKQITDNGAIINLGISIEISEDFDIRNEKDNSKLKDDIASTLYHELNHCFEHYKRVVAKSNITRPEKRSFSSSLSWADNIWKFPNKIWKYWSTLTYYLYFSEHHETRANVQEIYYYIKKYSSTELKDIRIYQMAENMESFDAQKFYDGLIQVISNHEPYIGIEKTVANRIKDMWITTYKRECESQKVKPVISFKTLEKMDCLEFLKYWQKRINRSGKIIKRKAHNIKHQLSNKNI